MRRQQIQQRYFGSVQRCNKRLRALFDAGLAQRTFFALSPHEALSYGSQAIYTLGKAGVPLVAAQLGWDIARVRERQRHGTPAYLAHTLEIAQFHLELEATIARQASMKMERFVPELLARHEYGLRDSDGGLKQQVFKPDAVFVLAAKEGRAGYAVEIDLGHTSQTEFGIKMQIHASYRAANLFSKRYEVNDFITLCLTTTPARQENLLALLRRIEYPSCWISTFAEQRDKGALGAIWRAPFGEKPLRLQVETA